MNTEKFTGKAEVYSRYRPSYPQALFDYLYNEIGFKKTHIIADIGSGTGILTQAFLKRGNKVIGIEPNDDMRHFAEEQLRSFGNFISLNATAEATTLETASVDYITVAQAFHWFDLEAFKTECQRILRPEGKVVLIWNSRNPNNKFTEDLGALEQRFCSDFKGFSGGLCDKADNFQDFFKNGAYIYRTFPNDQRWYREQFIGGCLSASYALSQNNPNYDLWIKSLNELFDNYQVCDYLHVPYYTRSYVGYV